MPSVRAWNGNSAAAALAQVRHSGRIRNTPCVICQRAIDYDLPGTDPMGCTVQHIKSRSRHPELTWRRSNWAPAHRSCNRRWGDRDMPDGTPAEPAGQRPNPTSGWNPAPNNT